MDQFVTRFLLKETANQIQSLLSSVESAVEAIEEQTSQIRYVSGTYGGAPGSLTLSVPQTSVTLGQVAAPPLPSSSFSNCSMRTHLAPST